MTPCPLCPSGLSPSLPDCIVDVESMAIFPMGWCETNGYQLTPPHKPVCTYPPPMQPHWLRLPTYIPCWYPRALMRLSTQSYKQALLQALHSVLSQWPSYCVIKCKSKCNLHLWGLGKLPGRWLDCRFFFKMIRKPCWVTCSSGIQRPVPVSGRWWVWIPKSNRSWDRTPKSNRSWVWISKSNRSLVWIPYNYRSWVWIPKS